MRGADLFTSAFWFVFGVWVTWAGVSLGHGPLTEPGAGFLVAWVGVFMAIVAAVLFAGALRRSGAGIGEMWRGARVGKVALAVALLAAYALLLPTVGFLIASFVLLVALFRTIDPLGWRGALIAATVASGGSWLLFKVVLGTQLPAGWLG